MTMTAVEPVRLTEPAVPAAPDGRRTRLAALDLFRFVAALGVALFHLVAVAGTGSVRIWGEPPEAVFGAFYRIAAYGWVGVPFFFMISGFVVCMTAWDRTPEQYLRSRFVRLFPALWVCMTITTVVAAGYPRVFTPVPFRAFFANMFLLADPLGVRRVDDVYWTLWLELKFYLLFLVVVWIGVTYRNVVAFCLLWSAASVLAAEIGKPWLDALTMRGNSHYFVAGIAFHLIHRRGSRPELWLLVALSWALSMHYYEGNPWQAGHGMSYTPSSIAVTLCFAALALLAVGRLDRIRWRPLAALGTATYPFYLLHYVAGFAAVHLLRRHTTIDPVLLLVLVVVALIGVSVLVSRQVERPLAARLTTAFTRRTVPGDAEVPGAVGTSPAGRAEWTADGRHRRR
ncbi:acyltransferase [Actinoplanes cyaneus]|uniref:Acyltransferase n=1 Tax=Actinoplanes cyaneus TaxID=52696 RepID=A0A919MFN5_9ACTN|nr:acyltransferase [Actinoplanes cyaneus]MCW2135604.1 Peptidoglycan/LPS O-acetylase OafA/YrhL, contains acyltransferase and SGNH-hydrolase domains [Actinoplanes cyaneus]GID69396.1 acyltransferase [Actinoplanes cyaneus]